MTKKARLVVRLGIFAIVFKTAFLCLLAMRIGEVIPPPSGVRVSRIDNLLLVFMMCFIIGTTAYDVFLLSKYIKNSILTEYRDKLRGLVYPPVSADEPNTDKNAIFRG